MHIWETATLENVAYILKRPDFAKLSPVKFFILRGDETLYGYLPVAAVKTAQR
jgi:serine protease Do